jgi:hypothetical protein
MCNLGTLIISVANVVFLFCGIWAPGGFAPFTREALNVADDLDFGWQIGNYRSLAYCDSDSFCEEKVA